MQKVNNIHRILNYIIISKGVSRADISRKFGLNKATVSYIIAELEEKKLIAQIDELKATGGRHSVLYELNRDFSTILCINLKPQFIKYHLCNIAGEIIYDGAENISIENEQMLKDNLINIIGNILEKYPNNIAIGIGIHGTVSKSEKIHFSPFLNISNLDIKEYLQSKFVGYNFFIENEANITALGENLNMGEENVVVITNSKGIGSGIINGYNIYKGSDGFAGEIGHTTVVPKGLECTCGNQGCLELYASEENIIAKASAVKNRKLNKNEFLELYQNNDIDIAKIYFQSLEYLSIAINNLLAILNPSTIILSGFLYYNINETIDYMHTNFNNKLKNNTRIIVSPVFEEAFCAGFSRQIVNEIFINNNEWTNW